MCPYTAGSKVSVRSTGALPVGPARRSVPCQPHLQQSCIQLGGGTKWVVPGISFRHPNWEISQSELPEDVPPRLGRIFPAAHGSPLGIYRRESLPPLPRVQVRYGHPQGRRQSSRRWNWRCRLVRSLVQVNTQFECSFRCSPMQVVSNSRVRPSEVQVVSQLMIATTSGMWKMPLIERAYNFKPFSLRRRNPACQLPRFCSRTSRFWRASPWVGSSASTARKARSAASKSRPSWSSIRDSTR